MEVNALFLAIHLTHENDDENLNVPAKVSSRLILVTHLYIFVHNIVVKCFQYVGLTEFIVRQNFVILTCFIGRSFLPIQA